MIAMLLAALLSTADASEEETPTFQPVELGFTTGFAPGDFNHHVTFGGRLAVRPLKWFMIEAVASGSPHLGEADWSKRTRALIENNRVTPVIERTLFTGELRTTFVPGRFAWGDIGLEIYAGPGAIVGLSQKDLELLQAEDNPEWIAIRNTWGVGFSVTAGTRMVVNDRFALHLEVSQSNRFQKLPEGSTVELPQHIGRVDIRLGASVLFGRKKAHTAAVTTAR